ncbi:MAG: glycosyltransferase family 4 protein [Planctomycetota bacterium]|jgi:glycosyltransferase involved in cell wall biosynthesis
MVDNNNIKIVGAAFGDPKLEKTFSGVPKYLFAALSQHQVMCSSLSTRQLRLQDMFTGAVDFSKITRNHKPGLNYAWLWQKSTVDKLTQRFEKQLDAVNDFNVVLQIGTHVRVNRPKVKHYCLTDITLAQALRAKQFVGNKLLATSRLEGIKVQKSIFDTCEIIFVNSNWVKNSIIEDYDFEPERIHVVGVGASVPARRLDCAEERNGHKILFIGRDWERKGGPMLLDAFLRVKKKMRDASLTIIGCSPRISASDVNVLGQIDKSNEQGRQIFEDAFSKASVLCVPSLFEPFGICFLEAQLHEMPVITFMGEGRCDAIQDGKTGVLVKDRSAKALTDVLLEVLTDPEKSARMGKSGREFIMQNFTWDHIASKILNVICKNK